MLDSVVMLRVELPPTATLVGLNAPDAPDGSPLMLNEIDPAKPLIAAVETVELPPLPCTTEIDVGLSDMEKSGTGTDVTVNVRVVVCVPGVPVPLIVSG